MPTVFLTTLGCAKNQVDSEKIECLLTDSGYQLTDDAASADVVMVNTCAFIEEARKESVETILDTLDVKGDTALSVVIGCMAQRFGTDVRASLPEVDAVVGLDRYPQLVTTLDELTGWRRVESPGRRPRMDILHTVRRPHPRSPYSYVKVAEGCDKPCTFCAIPLIRGKQRSRATHEISAEVADLTAAGVREVVLVAQDLAAYGRDLAERANLVELLGMLSGIDGLARLRLLYLYPKEIRAELIDEIAARDVVVNYFDLSLQHSNVDLLRSMRRSGNEDVYRALIDRIRASIPDATLRSSFIVGFPGETEAHIEELAHFLTEIRLDWAGFFPYSAEEGTPASDLRHRVPRAEVDERLRYLTEIQEEITYGSNMERVGDRVEVLVDAIEDGVPVGRSAHEAPEIDGVIYLDRGAPGDLLTVEITGAFGADSEGRVVDTRQPVHAGSM